MATKKIRVCCRVFCDVVLKRRFWDKRNDHTACVDRARGARAGMSDIITADAAAAQQDTWNTYLKSQEIDKVFVEIVKSLIAEQPEKPIEHMIQFLATNHVAAVGGVTIKAEIVINNKTEDKMIAAGIAAAVKILGPDDGIDVDKSPPSLTA